MPHGNRAPGKPPYILQTPAWSQPLAPRVHGVGPCCVRGELRLALRTPGAPYGPRDGVEVVRTEGPRRGAACMGLCLASGTETCQVHKPVSFWPLVTLTWPWLESMLCVPLELFRGPQGLPSTVPAASQDAEGVQANGTFMLWPQPECKGLSREAGNADLWVKSEFYVQAISVKQHIVHGQNKPGVNQGRSL